MEEEQIGTALQGERSFHPFCIAAALLSAFGSVGPDRPFFCSLTVNASNTSFHAKACWLFLFQKLLRMERFNAFLIWAARHRTEHKLMCRVRCEGCEK